MKMNKVLSIILILCILVSLAGCKEPISMVKSLFEDEEQTASSIIESNEEEQQDEELRNTVLYYKDDKGFLIPVMRKVPWTEGRGIAKATLKAMVDTPANREDIKGIGLIPVIPPNTEILGMSIKEGLCKVDFTDDFLGYFSKEEEEALIKAVVYTLTEFPTIDRVQLMINGKIPESLSYGTKIAKAITRDNINYVSTTPSNDKVIVYFEGTANGLESYFVPVTKAVEKKDATPVNILDALDALVEGPPEGLGLFSEIPEGTQVMGIDVNNGVACINLTEEILEIKENPQVVGSVAKSFGLTIREQYPDIAGVKLMVNGKALEVEEMEKDEPMIVPTFANQY
ncbi:GerMN domain-containing protein [Clostridiaceae bacterium 35-E11]